MPKRILQETLEELEDLGKEVGKDFAEAAQDIGGEILAELGRPSQKKPPKRQKRLGQKIAKMRAAEQVKTEEDLERVREELTKRESFTRTKLREYLVPPQKPQELPLKNQQELKKRQELAELEEKKKKRLPPPVAAAKPKMGTGERKLGISG